MKRLAYVMALFAAAVVMMAQSARAEEEFRFFRGDQRLIVTGIAVGAASTGAYLALRNRGGGVTRMTQLSAWGISTVGCMALSPIVGGIVVQRELTRREVHVMLADCIVPFIGGWVMHRYFDRHPERDSVPPPPVRMARHHKHH